MHSISRTASEICPLLAGTARSGTAASAARCSARPGSTTTAITVVKARAESSRPARRSHPIVRGIKDGDIWGPTDVYGVHLPLPGDSKPLVLGQVVADMTPTGKPVEGKKNDPMMPVAWVKTFTGESGKPARVFTTTMGAATDLESQGVRRMLVNAVYWALGLEDKISARERRQPGRRIQAPPLRLQRRRQGRQARGACGTLSCETRTHLDSTQRSTPLAEHHRTRDGESAVTGGAAHPACGRPLPDGER